MTIEIALLRPGIAADIATWSLRPSYSLSKLAATTLESHGERDGAEYATDWYVAAYFPTELTLEEAGKLAMERWLG